MSGDKDPTLEVHLTILKECFDMLILQDSLDKDSLSSLLHHLDACDRYTRLNSLISKNELLDEIPTKHIPFLMVSCLQALCLERQSKTPEALALFEQFLEQVQRMYQDDSVQCALNSSSNDPTQRRSTKITRFKETRELMKLIKEVKPQAIDQEKERVLYVTMLKLCTLQMIDRMDMLKAEVTLVNMRDNKEQKESKHTTAYPIPSLRHVQEPFMLVKDRTQVKVFGPGHSLPTMTIDEYLDLELKQGTLIAQAQKKDNVKEMDEDEDDIMSYDTVKVYKQRTWDTFKEEHPRGSGNRHNRS